MGKTYQIWGSFSNDGDRSTPTTTSLFEKGALMGDGKTTLEEFNRQFAESDNDTFELMKEFSIPDDLTIESVIRLVDHMYWDGWFRGSEECEDDGTDDPVELAASKEELRAAVRAAVREELQPLNGSEECEDG